MAGSRQTSEKVDGSRSVRRANNRDAPVGRQVMVPFVSWWLGLLAYHPFEYGTSAESGAATMADPVLELRRHLGHGLAVARDVEDRVVSEAALAPGLERDLPLHHSAAAVKPSRLVHDGYLAHVAAPALLPRHPCQFLQDPLILGGAV